MKLSELKDFVTSGKLDADLMSKCGISKANLEEQHARILRAADKFAENYDREGTRDVFLFSVGGRSEISGNHTDHNFGRVIAASINLDIIAIAAKRTDGTVRVKSHLFPEDVVSASAICTPDESKFFTSESIIAGMQRAMLDAGYSVGGFDAYTTSNVLKGSGISSSAAFEVMIGNIISHLYNNGEVDNVQIAKMSQFAENKYFGKPCGLMDQTACAVGGFISIDFADPSVPVIRKMDFDLTAHGYSLCIVNTGGNHADLNADYASVPAEMKAVAAKLGRQVLRGLTAEDIVSKIPALRNTVGDRAILRALHFIAENDRVEKQAAALEAGDIKAFLDGVIESGNSSYKYLQNVYTTKNVEEQGLSLALCLTEAKLAGTGAAWRVHGGGFAGTIQAFVPTDIAEDYREYMDAVFGDGACHILSVRLAGAIKLI